LTDTTPISRKELLFVYLLGGIGSVSAELMSYWQSPSPLHSSAGGFLIRKNDIRIYLHKTQYIELKNKTY